MTSSSKRSRRSTPDEPMEDQRAGRPCSRSGHPGRLRCLGQARPARPVPRRGAAGRLSRHSSDRPSPCSTCPASVPPGTVGDFIDDVAAGDVVVIDNGGRTDCTVWGDIMTQYAGAHRFAATVIDGVCRDVNKALGDGYPLFSRGRFMRTGKDRVQVGAVNSRCPSARPASCRATSWSPTPTAW